MCKRNNKMENEGNSFFFFGGTGNNIEMENVESGMEVGRDNDEKLGMVETDRRVLY